MGEDNKNHGGIDVSGTSTVINRKEYSGYVRGIPLGVMLMVRMLSGPAVQADSPEAPPMIRLRHGVIP